MSQLYPLRFEPVFRRYIWGGTRLHTELGKPIGRGTCAESWEIVDHGVDQVRCAFGSLQGSTLHEIVAAHGDELFGPTHRYDSFPLLLKFLDAQTNLSVQVHPNDVQAAQIVPPDLGKTEAWVVLDAPPGSLIYAGLKAGVTREQFAKAVTAGDCLDLVHRFEPCVGDCVFIPAGTVHALGAGLMICEIQQASDTTYRLFDWNRPGSDSKPRPLHIDQGLEVINFNSGPITPVHASNEALEQRLVDCDKFVMTRRRLSGASSLPLQRKFHLLAVLEGSFTISGDPSGRALTRGEVALLPASLEKVRLVAANSAMLLDIHLP